MTSEQAENALLEVYRSIIDGGTPYLTADLATAEMVKVASNSFLATKISFINAIAEVCEAVGADVVKLADALGYDDRIGRRFLNAGLGFGGGCLPKDIRAFSARAGELGVGESLRFLPEVDKVNIRRREKAVAVACALVDGDFLGKSIAVLGAAFKPDSDDVRDSPALNVAAADASQGRRRARATIRRPWRTPRRGFPRSRTLPSPRTRAATSIWWFWPPNGSSTSTSTPYRSGRSCGCRVCWTPGTRSTTNGGPPRDGTCTHWGAAR